MREKKAVNIQVGANIQSAREKAGYTQERLSEIVGITPNHLSAIERGVSGASLELLQKLCGLFGVSADYLLFGKTAPDDETEKFVRQLRQVPREYKRQVEHVLSALLEVIAIQNKDNVNK